jgi:CDP-6-deoxy-D-xylo-4-hexulose-3-dehydrase
MTESQAALTAQIRTLVTLYFAQPVPQPDGPRLPLHVPSYGADEVNEALDCLLSTRVTMGDKVRRFERLWAEYLGVREAVMVNSGSSANLVAAAALVNPTRPRPLAPGDEVIVPAVAWSTTYFPLVNVGLVPVLVDVDLDTFTLDPEAAAAAVGPRTRALMPVHLLGNACDMRALEALAARHELVMVEDTCEAHGARFEGRHVGTFGAMGTFSFYFSHHISTIEGGMVVTDDDALADLARSLRAHGWIRDMSNKEELASASPWIDPRFLFVHVGYNVRPMELQAAFGRVQLQRLDEFNEARRRNADWLLGQLTELSERGDLQFVTEQSGGQSTWFGFTVLCRDAETRRRLSEHLEERRIETRAIVAGNLTVQPAFRDAPHRTVGSLANSTMITQRGLFIGNHPNLDQARLDHIVEAFRSFFA